jgi:hypothetical protein
LKGKLMVRKIQYYNNIDNGVWCYFVSGEKNPCGCRSNCYHYEYDEETIIGVCNACDRDIYEVNEEYKEEKLEKGVWK